MEERVSGFIVRGDWGDVVEHGERMVTALRESGHDSAALEAFDEWRPKAHERLGEDVNEKTAEQASVQEGPAERDGQTAGEEVQAAGEKLTESYEKLDDEDTGGAVSSWQDSIGHVARAADAAGRKAIRTVEDTVYRRVMTRVSPYYFDNELVSANITRTRDGQYVFEVNVNDDDLKDAVREELEAFETDVDRWHVDTEKDTATAEAAEGVEAPRTEPDAEHTTN